MGDRFIYAWVKARGWVCSQIVRPLSIPFDRPGTLWWHIMARLWGNAYYADAFASFAEWRECVRGKAL